MAKRELSPRYLSVFFEEIATLLHAGIGMGDGLYMLYNDDDGAASRGLLKALYDATEGGAALSEAAAQCGVFPEYAVSMLRLGERTGRMEEISRALSAYYDGRDRLHRNLRDAIAYPVLLLVLMGAVLVLLVTRVLPVFENVFAQLGAQMSPLATTLMHAGQAVSGAALYILGAVAVLAVVAAAVYLVPAWHSRFAHFWQRNFGGRGIAGERAAADFAAAMAASMAGGLDAEESLELAGQVSGSSRQMAARLAACKAALDGGETLEHALSESGIFSRRDSRLLTLGIRAGSGDSVMHSIAVHAREEAETKTEEALAMAEPAIVIVLSVLVGAVLLSVMLPLLGVLSVIA